MDNKLSELKDVADYWRKVKSGELPAPGMNEISITACTLDGAVSRIAALLAELEASSLQCRGIEQERELFRLERTAHQLHAQALEQRIAELERITEGVDQLAIDGGWTARGMSEYAKSLEAKLATPVRLPPLMDGELFGKNSGTANAHNNAITACSIAIRGAGFKSEVTATKCVGDKQ
ncbi:Uncharacterised protein [Serratia quinivorans]|nr:Uncharacterised protein [Serratia quinivorans]